MSVLSTYCLLSSAPVVFGYVACESSQIPVVASSGELLHYLVPGDLVEVRLKPLFDTVFCLAYVLFPACATGDTIHNVIAVASSLCSGMVFSTCHL